MAEVDITINNRSYRIACKDGEENRIKALASLIDNQVQQLSEKIGQLGESRMILLASLVLLDKSDEAEKEAEKIISITADKIENLARKFSDVK
jgi:cell division protein ZapA